ncbi:peptidase [Novosphingobium sp. Gsoil 351]|nr:peptidase [Novosphingobium sp. Gsoil 351]
MAHTVARSAIKAMIEQGARAEPEEACGLLLGTPERIEAAIPTRNVHPTPRTHFEIDPVALIAAHKAERSGAQRIAGYWHSHPTGSTEPSATDRMNASGDGKVWAIVGAGMVTFWRDTPQGFVLLSTRIDAG